MSPGLLGIDSKHDRRRDGRETPRLRPAHAVALWLGASAVLWLLIAAVLLALLALLT